MNLRPLNARGANACILRSGPKTKWDKDRGKEPTRDKADYPWFWGWDELTPDFAGGSEFDGNRWNDLHYKRATKQSARDRQRTTARQLVLKSFLLNRSRCGRTSGPKPLGAKVHKHRYRADYLQSSRRAHSGEAI